MQDDVSVRLRIGGVFVRDCFAQAYTLTVLVGGKLSESTCIWDQQNNT